MHIDMSPTTQVKPYPGNPRNNDGAVDAVAASIREFGFRVPIVVDVEGVLAKLFDPGVKDGLCDPDEVPEQPDVAITKPGDLWILGEHRLLCGDSANAADVDRLLDGAPMHLVNTDPPYNVKVEPRSNNAIAAGLSSFSNDAASKKLRAGQGNAAFDIARGKTKVGQEHHQGFDLARHPEKSQPTHRKMRAKDRPLANDFVQTGDEMYFTDHWF